MEKKALLVFSHQITENQEKELQKDFKVEKIEILPYNLQKIWSNVRINDEYMKNLSKIKKYIKKNFKKGDVLLIQGNWGYTYNLVKWSIENKYFPIYSYTERNVETIKEGEKIKKISYFQHIKFFKYK